ncbi:hypothetical protein FNF28_00366 [Cafeteria roenbergensis]|uniref:HIT-type domain-containing protein n=1 Tax=Cafeteria roenbergensis TaxID=33653 RepID=A0A5A8E3I6_CAFRO|nr:hypothetical protein FNF28_00366 [Cafeteria roenbergensis]
MNSARFQVCRVCKENEGRYTCPRCNAVYCSVRCYQEHNSECFDAFARAHIADDEGGSGSGSAAASAAGPPALPPAHRRALAEDTVERLRDIAEAWGEGGATPGAADGREADTPLTALPVDARRSFLRDVAAGRVRPPHARARKLPPSEGRGPL